ncbi:MAG TPA: prepilin-type N-terminal cleavage/methylation domain-containing protein [Acidimicrobiales bacterium]|nr:prepilin-type N-terminal cleavage/methylation domain-containing protein [Acidimicrobiales bacterium]
MNEKRRDEGFTLIELLIVIIILAILAAIVIFAVGNTSTSAKQASCNSDAKTVETAVEAYKAEVGSYPSGTSPTAAMAELTTTHTVNGIVEGPWLRQAPSAITSVNGYAVSLDGSADGIVLVQTDAISGLGHTAVSYDANPTVCTTIT